MDHDPDHVESDEDHHGAGAPVMQTANQPAGGDLVGDECDAVVGVLRARDVVDGQEDPGQYLVDHHQ